VAAQHAQLRAAGGVPQPHRAVIAGAGQRGARRVEGAAADGWVQLRCCDTDSAALPNERLSAASAGSLARAVASSAARKRAAGRKATGARALLLLTLAPLNSGGVGPRHTCARSTPLCVRSFNAARRRRRRRARCRCCTRQAESLLRTFTSPCLSTAPAWPTAARACAPQHLAAFAASRVATRRWLCMAGRLWRDPVVPRRRWALGRAARAAWRVRRRNGTAKTKARYALPVPYSAT